MRTGHAFRFRRRTGKHRLRRLRRIAIDPFYDIAAIRELQSCWPQQLAEWLSSVELQRLEQLSHPARRTQWLAGRWLSRSLINKAGVTAANQVLPNQIEIRSSDDTGRSCRPCVSIRGVTQALDLSISHTDYWVAVSLWTESGCRIGIDVVDTQLPTGSGLNFWLTPDEESLLSTPTVTIPVLWSMKEATYKAVNCGEPFSPAKWVVACSGEGVFQCANPEYPAAAPSIRSVRHHDAVIAIVACPGRGSQESSTQGL